MFTLSESDAALLFISLLTGVTILWYILGKLQIMYMHRDENRLPKQNFKLKDGFTHNKYAKSAGCIVWQDQKILFIWTPFNFANYWASWKHSLPGGTAKKNLMAWEAAALETFEETGILVEISEEVACFDDFILFFARPIKPIEENHLRTFKKRFEVSKLQLAHPKDMPSRRARFRKQHIFLQEWADARCKHEAHATGVAQDQL